MRRVNVAMAKEVEALGWRGNPPADKLERDGIIAYLEQGFVDEGQAEEAANARAATYALYHLPEPGPDGWYEGVRRPDPTTGRIPLPVTVPIEGRSLTLDELHALASVEAGSAWNMSRRRGNTL